MVRVAFLELGTPAGVGAFARRYRGPYHGVLGTAAGDDPSNLGPQACLSGLAGGSKRHPRGIGSGRSGVREERRRLAASCPYRDLDHPIDTQGFRQ